MLFLCTGFLQLCNIDASEKGETRTACNSVGVM